MARLLSRLATAVLMMMSLVAMPAPPAVVHAAGPGTIAGHVSAGSEPVGDATVELFSYLGESIATTTTNGNGDYQFVDLEVSWYRIQAVSPTAGIRYHPAAYQQSDAGVVMLTDAEPSASGIDITMPDGEVRGTVRFRGTALQGATVSLMASYGGLNATMPATTGADGSFRIRGVDANRFEVLVSYEGVQHTAGIVSVTSTTPIVDGQDFVIPSGVISGTVTDGQGNPLPEGEVFLSSGFDRRYRVPVTGGMFTATGMPDGTYAISAAKQHSTSVTSEAAATIGPGAYDVSGVELVLPAAGTISGSVEQPLGAGDLVEAISIDRTHRRVAVVQADGTYSIEGLPAADYRVGVRFDRGYGPEAWYYPGARSEAGSAAVQVTPGLHAADVDLPAPPTASWSGSILLSDGTPVSSAQVSVFRRFDSYWTEVSTVATGLDGSFIFADLPAGCEMTLRIEPPSGSGLLARFLGGGIDPALGQPVVLAPGELHVQGDTVWLGASLSGSVTDANGSPVDGTVYAFAEDVGWVVGDLAGGQYEVTGLVPGTYRAYVVPNQDSGGLAPRYLGNTDDVALATEVTLSDGDVVGGQDVELVQGAEISGRLTIANGQPVSGATVILEGLNGPTFAFVPGASATSQPDGTYVLKGLPAGSVKLGVVAPPDSGLLEEWSGGVRDASSAIPIPLTAGGVVSEYDLTLDRGVFGRIANDFRQGPVTLAYFSYSPLVVCPAGSGFSFPGGCTDGGGVPTGPSNNLRWFHAGPAVPGRSYTARGVGLLADISGPNASFIASTSSQFDCVVPIDDASGHAFCESSPTPVNGAISGRVIGPDGVGVGGVDVVLQYRTFTMVDVMPTTVTTNADGYYTMPDVPPGAYRVKFVPPYTRPDLLPVQWTYGGHSTGAGEGDELQVVAGQTRAGVSLTFDPSATGRASITEGGLPLGQAFARVVAMCRVPAEYANGFFNCNDGSPAILAFWNGTDYDFPVVTPGVYSIRAGEVFDGRLGNPVLLPLAPGDRFACTLAIEGEGASNCEVFAANEDDDGVAAAVEQGAPNGGDGNADGIPDAAQPDVTSIVDPTLPSGGGSGYITLAVEQPASGPSYALANVSVAMPPADSPPPVGAMPQTGLVGFDVTNLPVPPVGSTTGETASVDVLLPSAANAYFKFDQATRQWVDATSLATFHPGPETVAGVDRWRVTLMIVDNGFGDADPTFGVISDPGVFVMRSVDVTPPEVSVMLLPYAPDGSSGWYRGDVHIDWTVLEGESSSTLLTDGCDDLDITADQSAVMYTCTASSGGGAAIPVSVSVARDASPPTLQWVGGPTDGATYVYGTVPAPPTCSASDALSGAGSCTVTGHSTSVGVHTMIATASDRAGNTTTVERTYTVAPWTLSGFAQPVDMGAVWNTVKGGATVPLKFEVFQGSMELTDVSAIRAVTSAEVPCSLGISAEDAIETVVMGGSPLRYDAGSGRFIQNWTTPKAPGSCRRVTVVTLDGSSIVAYFKLK